MTTYKVHTGGERWRRFASLAAARAFCSAVFERTGHVLTIIEEAA